MEKRKVDHHRDDQISEQYLSGNEHPDRSAVWKNVSVSHCCLRDSAEIKEVQIVPSVRMRGIERRQFFQETFRSLSAANGRFFEERDELVSRTRRLQRETLFDQNLPLGPHVE